MKTEVIHWESFSTWEPLIRTFFGDKVSEIIQRIRTEDTSQYPIDDPDWLKVLMQASGDTREYLEAGLALALRGYFLRLYHGCRPTDVSSYTSQGLRIHRRDDLIKEIRELVRNDPRLSSVDIDKNAAEIQREWDEGRLFMVFDHRYMIEFAPHYLIYGSEFIAAVLGVDNRAPLLERGTPTFIHVDLPCALIPKNTLEGLASEMFKEWTRNIARSTNEVRVIDGGVEMTETLDPKHIVGHSNPDL